MAADLAHPMMPKPDGMMRLLFFEVVEPIALVVTIACASRRGYTILVVLYTHVHLIASGRVAQLVVDACQVDKSVCLDLLSQTCRSSLNVAWNLLSAGRFGESIGKSIAPEQFIYMGLHREAPFHPNR